MGKAEWEHGYPCGQVQHTGLCVEKGEPYDLGRASSHGRHEGAEWPNLVSYVTGLPRQLGIAGQDRNPERPRGIVHTLGWVAGSRPGHVLLALCQNIIVSLSRFWSRLEIAVGFASLLLASMLLYLQPGAKRSQERNPALGLVAALAGGVAMLLFGSIDETRAPDRTRIVHDGHSS